MGTVPSPTSILIYFAIMFGITYILRLVPFLAIRQLRNSRVIEELGATMPLGVMAALIIYCFRDITPTDIVSVGPALVGTVATIILHLWRGQAMLSMVGGVAAYGLTLTFLAG